MDLTRSVCPLGQEEKADNVLRIRRLRRAKLGRMQPGEHVCRCHQGCTCVVVSYLFVGEDLAACSGPATPEERRAALEIAPAWHELLRVGAHLVKGGGPHEAGPGLLRHGYFELRGESAHLAVKVSGYAIVVNQQHIRLGSPGPGIG